MSSNIESKVILIAGASSGIGGATAMLLAQRGARLMLVARGQERLEALAARITQAGGACTTARLDVSKREDVASIVALALERYGQLDVLVNNTGIGPVSPLDDLRVEDWEAMVDINIKGLLYGIAASLPVFRAQGFGHFINIASTAALHIVPNMAVYAATKAAMRVISKGLRQEAGPNLRVTVVSPGFVKTGFADSISAPEMKAQVQGAMEKMAISPEAIARATAFAIEQARDVDVGEIVIRPTAQS